MIAKKIRLAVFGSTGSIGKSTLEIARSYPDKFEVTALIANSNTSQLKNQIEEFRPKYAGIADAAAAETFKSSVNLDGCKLYCADDVNEIAGFEDYDVLLAAIVGFAGLKSVLKAAKAGKKIALANKESLVAAGALLQDEVSENGAKIIPVDSEHSAIFQLLDGAPAKDVAGITLTASGGPFLNMPLKDFESIKPEEALKHPRWQMGNKISLDSATMFNKALELIEAKWLFDLKPEQIDIIIHPQSIIHSMVNFTDGSTFAQLSDTDMKGPISFAINYPDYRLHGVLEKLDFAKLQKLEFYELDRAKFPAVELARSALNMGSAAGAVFNSANEAAGAAFLAGKILFTDIYRYVNDALSQFGSLNYSTYEDLVEISSQVNGYLSKSRYLETQ